MPFIENTLHPELLSIHATNPLLATDAGARSVMYGNHITQRLCIEHPTEKRIQTGVDRVLGQFTFAERMPETGLIIEKIDRYPKQVDADSIAHNPERLVIYQDVATKEYGCFSLTYHKSFHQYFGFLCKQTDAVNQIKQHTIIEKGTIFTDTPAISDYGGYQTGRELNIAFMSHPAVSEDGILICSDVLPKLRFPVFEKRTVSFGTRTFPMNLYGNAGKFKPFPDIGEAIREDGLLMLLRPYDTMLSPVENSIYDVMEPDYVFDEATYVRGGHGVVVDIKMFHDDTELSPTPTGMMEHVDKYGRALQRYYQRILDVERRLRYEAFTKYGDYSIQLKPELHRLLVYARAMLSADIPRRRKDEKKKKQKLNKIYRKDPVDDYRIVFTVQYNITPTQGFKLSDQHGGLNS